MRDFIWRRRRRRRLVGPRRLTSWLRKTRKRSAGEVRNFSLMLNLQVGSRTPVLTGADVLLEEEICETNTHKRKQK